MFWFPSFLQSLAWGLLFVHLGLYLDGSVNWFVMGGLFAAGLLWGRESARRGLRWGAALAGNALLLFLIRWIGMSVSGTLGWERALMALDMTFWPYSLPLILLGLSVYGRERSPLWCRWEPLILGLLWMLLFWSQGGYEISLFPHPLWVAGGSLLFSLAGLGLRLFRGDSLEPGHLPSFPSGSSLSQKGSRRRRRLGSLLTALVLLIPLLVVFFLYTLGRYEEGATQGGGGLVKPTLFRFDFSDFIKLESEISMKDDLVLMYHQTDAMEAPVYLRRFILSGYTPEKGFFRRQRITEQGGLTEVPHRPVTLDDPGFTGRYSLEQEYYLVNFDPDSLLAVDYPVEVTPYEKWDESSFLRIYAVESKTSRSRAGGIRFSGERGDRLSASAWEELTDYGGREAIKALAEEVTRDYSTPYGKVRALENFFHDEFFYSLRPGISPAGDQLSYFLFDSRQGYCSYFAFSMALMCRSLGIPARVAVGFWVEPSTGVLQYYPVQANQAHAWVEVFMGETGWLTYDPTSSQMAPGEDYEFSLGGDPREVKSLLEEILKNRGALVEENRPGEDSRESGSPWRWVTRRFQDWGASVLLLLLLILYPLALGIPWFRLLLRSRWAAAPAQRMRARLGFLLLLQARRGIARRRGDTLAEAVEAWGLGPEWKSLVWDYLREEYGPGTDEAAFAEREKRLRKAFFRGLPRKTRLRILLNPFKGGAL